MYDTLHQLANLISNEDRLHWARIKFHKQHLFKSVKHWVSAQEDHYPPLPRIKNMSEKACAVEQAAPHIPTLKMRSVLINTSPSNFSTQSPIIDGTAVKFSEVIKY